MSKLILVLMVLCVGSAQAAETILDCAYTNDGFGGDEGYEIAIVKTDANSYEAVLTSIDPGGGLEYARLPVQRETNSELMFTGEKFWLAVHDWLPKTANGFSYANFEIPSERIGIEKGATLCRGSAIQP